MYVVQGTFGGGFLPSVLLGRVSLVFATLHTPGRLAHKLYDSPLCFPSCCGCWDHRCMKHTWLCMWVLGTTLWFSGLCDRAFTFESHGGVWQFTPIIIAWGREESTCRNISGNLRPAWVRVRPCLKGKQNKTKHHMANCPFINDSFIILPPFLQAFISPLFQILGQSLLFPI